ncbi:MAG: Formamidase [Rhizobacter sp.]|nr:Formamidase [Rhizobacter sp.]
MAHLHIKVNRSTPLGTAPSEGHNRWHPDIDPMVRIDSGDTVEMQTRDGLDCQVCAATTAADLIETNLGRAHPLTGPVYVNGAERGDLLAVHITDVKPHTEGFTVIMPGFGFLRDLFDTPHIVHWQMDGSNAVSDQLPGVRVPGAPFMGVMGLAPSHELLATITSREAALHARGGAVLLPDASMAVPTSGAAATHGLRTIPPRETGGNLDIKQLVAGTTLYLPVYAQGALFSVGDAHFAQGDGESCGTAIETSAIFTARFELMKGEATRRRQKDPSYGRTNADAGLFVDRTRNFYATTGTCIAKDGSNLSEDLKLATHNALVNMIDQLCDAYRYTPEQAYSLVSVAVNLRISQIVDVPNVTVSAFLPLDVFV